LDGTAIISSREALDLTAIPDSLLIVGGGVEGCEFASLFSVLGTKVTLVEMLPRILPTEDEEVSALLAAELKKLGVTILVNARVEKVAVGPDGVSTTLADGNTVASAKVLVSIGRRFNTGGKTDELGLEETGVQLGRRGEILVNERMETNVPGVYAIGDVTGKAMLAHVASAQGKVAVRNILGRPATMSYDVIPAGIFTFPEVGRVGLTEQEARQRGMEIKIGKFRPIGLGKAHASGETSGLMKIVTEAKTGRIVGVHLVGSHAADLIHEAAVAMQMGATAATLAETIHAHPTMPEGLMEAAEDVEGMAIHLARRKVSAA
ncbi:MAG: FAD-dependent oxidoreductase, partial [Nitrospirales bacterium]|nr:FAD-dependent oxidoreductase [Nitrospirales bacterium]